MGFERTDREDDGIRTSVGELEFKNMNLDSAYFWKELLEKKSTDSEGGLEKSIAT